MTLNHFTAPPLVCSTVKLKPFSTVRSPRFGTWPISCATKPPMVSNWLSESDSDNDFDTIGGLVAHEMGHVPKRGERTVLNGLSFTVLHTKGGAVKWFKVMPEHMAE